ncbi:hypothetical protein [Corynebacterium heidelbergense]|uniref:DUF8185 domain-containing protein n=1 Tax=Corynebacterium heidelbergense TaxID=2055947 RepID=A0A364VDD5_9CORY|nr:hypothetical protein [Corynebacterium heidelbergense]RAV34631.1 hypothetical protein CWC39_02190 [Corynebacterium heidelbergense]WCZ36195.1 hypothetical protein CHEID_03190 [Corynebacterium heidelbergense]
MTAALELVGPAESALTSLKRAATLAHRVLKMDGAALVRVRQFTVDARSQGAELYFSTPLHSLLAVRLRAVRPAAKDNGAVMSAEHALAALKHAIAQSCVDGVIPLGPRMDVMWAGALPAPTGYQLVDSVPGSVIRDLYRQMGREASENAGPAGMPPSLLEQELLSVTASSGTSNTADSAQASTGPGAPVGGSSQPSALVVPTVGLTGRVIAALGATGLSAAPTAPELGKYDYVRVSTNGQWNRVDALQGTVYTPRPGSLARTPS